MADSGKQTYNFPAGHDTGLPAGHPGEPFQQEGQRYKSVVNGIGQGGADEDKDYTQNNQAQRRRENL